MRRVSGSMRRRSRALTTFVIALGSRTRNRERGRQSLARSATTNRVTGWTYDAAGNTTSDGLHTYAYDAENRIRELDGGTAVYYYDGQGR